MGEYPWFRIRFKNGREGYKWGGILCSFGDPIPGIAGQCGNTSSLSGGGNTNTQRGPFGTDPLDYPIEAASGGGIVRSGPGMEFQKVTSLREFEPITVVGLAGVTMNGYPWYTIEFRGGQTGYHWGGLVCSTGRPFVGTFDTCANYRASLSGNNSSGNSGNSGGGGNNVEYSCNEGIPLQVSFRDENGQSFALFSHDSGPVIRVESVRTGSGFHYTNGFHELRGKGSQVILFEGGQSLDECESN